MLLGHSLARYHGGDGVIDKVNDPTSSVFNGDPPFAIMVSGSMINREFAHISLNPSTSPFPTRTILVLTAKRVNFQTELTKPTGASVGGSSMQGATAHMPHHR